MIRGKTSLLLATGLLVAAVPATAQAACADADIAPVGAESVLKANKALVCLVNAERVASGLPALKESRKLRKSASRWATRMDRENFFAHDRAGSTVDKRIAATGYLKGSRRHDVGENIGWGSGSLATPAARVRSWMAGGPHRRNILSGVYREIGAGIAGAPQSGAAGSVYVLNMGGLKQGKQKQQKQKQQEEPKPPKKEK